MEYKNFVLKYKPKENKMKNALISFLVGGSVGLLGELLTEFYMIFDIERQLATTFMIVTLIFLGCFLTAIGIFDNLVEKAKAGLIIPITGFAHSMMAATLDRKDEGLVNGIGSNMFNLARFFVLGSR